MYRLHVGESGHHHLHRQRLEDRNVALEIIVADLDVRLREEAENLRQQSAFVRRDAIRRPVLEVGAERYFLAHPVRLLLPLPEFIGPGITIHIVGAGGIEQADTAFTDECTRIDLGQTGNH